MTDKVLSEEEQLRANLVALAEKWITWKPSGWAPGPLFGAGQYATAQGCAQEIFDLLGLPMPPTTEPAFVEFDYVPDNVNNIANSAVVQTIGVAASSGGSGT